MIKFLFPLIGLATGIFITSEFSKGFEIGIIFFGISITVWLFLTLVSKRPDNSLRFSSLHLIWITTLFVGIGAFDFEFRSKPKIDEEIDGKNVIITGKIEDINYLANGDRFKVKVTDISDSISRKINFSNLFILLKSDGFIGSKGDLIQFETKPRLLSSVHRNAEYIEKLRHQGILYYSTVPLDNLSKIEDSNSLINYFSKIKDNLVVSLEKSNLKRPTAEFLISLLLGNKTLLSSEVKQTLNAAGLGHILALSGMHVAIIMLILLTVLFPIQLFGYRKTRLIIVISFVWIYVLITGSSLSTIRAAFMSTFIVGAYLLERKNSAMNGLLASIFLILVWNPYSLWDPGLQMSFFCVASILLFVEKLNPINHHLHPKTFKIANSFLIILITTFCTWILIAFYFNSLPLFFLPANLIILPFLPVFIGLGLLYTSLLLLGTDISWLARILDLLQEFFIKGADIFSVSGTSIVNLKVPPLAVFIWIIGILIFSRLLYVKSNRNKKYFLVASSLSFIVSLSIIAFAAPSSLSSIRFKHSFTKMEIEHFMDKQSASLEFPRQSISSSLLKNVEILSIDKKIHPDSLYKLINKSLSVPRYLFIGSGADSYQIAELIESSDFDGVILHHGVGKKKKEEIIHLLKDFEPAKIYSLREIGSLEFDL